MKIAVSRWLAALLVVVAAAGPAMAQALDPVVFDGRKGPGRAPIVMVLHGAGGSGPQVRRSSGLDRWAADAGVVAVYPSAPHRIWNDGRLTGLPHDPRLTDHDDVAGLLALAGDLDRQGIGDAKQLFLIGHSSGGGMALLMACSVPDALAGIAVVATKVLLNAPCPDAVTPVPAVFFYGTADQLNPHAGRIDPSNLRDAKLGLGHSAADSLAIWAARNGCGAAQVRQIDPTDDGVSVARTDWTGCTARLRYFEVEGGGHAWPGARPRRAILTRSTPELAVRDIDAGRESLRFFFGR